jgi:hypothetical protein
MGVGVFLSRSLIGSSLLLARRYGLQQQTTYCLWLGRDVGFAPTKIINRTQELVTESNVNIFSEWAHW